MIDAFKLRMIPDVPVGMFLSGGIDSSLVTAILQRHFGTQVHTFTIGFNEKKYNEATHARLVAEHLGTNLIQNVSSKRLKPRRSFRRVAPWTTSPLPTLPGIPTELRFWVASEQVKVVLSADGGDELFSGYNVYSEVLSHVARRARIPGPLRSAIVTGGNLVHPDKLDEWVSLSPLSKRLRQGPERSAHPARKSYSRLTDLWPRPGQLTAEAMSFWRGNDLARLTYGQERLRETADAYPGSLAEQMCLWDLHHYLPDDILVKVDRATMAVSIEGREPLLDHRIAEFAFRLPLHLRRGSLGPKHILRKILYEYVPRDIVDSTQDGLRIPLLDWFLRGDMNHLIGDDSFYLLTSGPRAAHSTRNWSRGPSRHSSEAMTTPWVASGPCWLSRCGGKRVTGVFDRTRGLTKNIASASVRASPATHAFMRLGNSQ